MCGISGIISKKGLKISKYEISEITDAIVHRGPDSYGYYFDRNLALGHRRLSIIDLNENANQPFVYNQNYILVYNGEIYNFKEIKSVLIKKGYFFKTNSDTEVIIASYIEWGSECLTKFNGMWSFALYDKTKEILFCARDRFGVKPFYFYDFGDKWVFGSEINQILKAGLIPKVNYKILADYIVLGIEEHNSSCFFEGVFKLDASHFLIYDLNSNKITTKRYYYLEENNEYKNLNETDAIKKFIELFDNSVNLRLISDVKVGTCLSGGLDSSYIASIASNIYNKKNHDRFVALTAKSTDKNNDETKFAEVVSNAKWLDWKVVTPSYDDFLKSIYEVIKVQQEPFGSPSIFMQFFIMMEASKLGCKVMLDGQGGDETLLGYERYYPAYLNGLSTFNKLIAISDASNNSRLSKTSLLQYMFYFKNSKIREYLTKKKFTFIDKEFTLLADFNIFKTIANSYNNPFELQKLEITRTQLPHLLKYEDRNSMYHAVEARLPFLDYRLVEFALSLPIELKINNGWTKYILRKAVEFELPNNIAWRKNKFGFEAPENKWLANRKLLTKEILSSQILSPLIHGNLNNINNRIFWRLFNVAIWEKIYNVRKN